MIEERGDGILAYDLTHPEQGRPIGGIFFKDRRHRGPESMVFLPDNSNPDQGLLVASFEYTGTLGVFSVAHQANPPLPLRPVIQGLIRQTKHPLGNDVELHFFCPTGNGQGFLVQPLLQ